MEKLEEPKNFTMMISSVTLLEWLLYDLNAAAEEGRAPRHFAAMYHCFEAAEFLVGHGADKGPQSKAGHPPFEIAVGRRSTNSRGCCCSSRWSMRGRSGFPRRKRRI
jgi:ankyrin repeat protein